MATGKYIGESLDNMEKIMGNISSYYSNTVYKNETYSIYWYINNNGYLHVLRPSKVVMDGRIIHYTIQDYLLTTKNKLKEGFTIGNYKTVNDLANEFESMVGKSI